MKKIALLGLVLIAVAGSFGVIPVTKNAEFIPPNPMGISYFK